MAMTEHADQQTILIVDDIDTNITVLAGVLQPHYQVLAARNGALALKLARKKDPKPDLILLDIMMPEMDGYEVCRQLKADPVTSDIPLIFVTSKDSVEEERVGLELGAVDYITKPISPAIVLARVHTHLALYDQRRELERKVRIRTEELNATRLKIIQRLGLAAEYKDNETGLHVIRVGHFSRLIAQAYGGNEDWVDLIFNAAPMHDIGKIGIPDKILRKEDKLDEGEWETMRSHTEIGARIIGDDDSSPLLQMSRDIALTHHEKWDGSGYPYGLKQEMIPLSGRIVAIADVFDALTSVRPYKKAWSVGDAIDLINRSSGSQFDPKLVDCFNKVIDEMVEFKDRHKD
ncbi:response regulator [Mariprofundus erugo]|uniref:Response regulator n=2 Tax=Mariprofundus erugo TaxID=2528639 RepID=A0A5R9GF29_9PROT|nr:response regulator [Mariprofundus erugo]